MQDGPNAGATGTADGTLDLILEQMADMRERLGRLEQASRRPGTKRSRYA